jgi:hypothetical protein
LEEDSDVDLFLNEFIFFGREVLRTEISQLC